MAARTSTGRLPRTTTGSGGPHGPRCAAAAAVTQPSSTLAPAYPRCQPRSCYLGVPLPDPNLKGDSAEQANRYADELSDKVVGHATVDAKASRGSPRTGSENTPSGRGTPSPRRGSGAHAPCSRPGSPDVTSARSAASRCRGARSTRPHRITRVILRPNGPSRDHDQACWRSMSPLRHRVVVDGELGPRYAPAFDAVTVSACNGTTEITGPINACRTGRGLLERIAGVRRCVHGSAHSKPRKASLMRSRDNNHVILRAIVGAGSPQSNNWPFSD